MVKKFLPFLFIIVTCYMLYVTCIFADFNQSYQDYLTQYDQYRSSLTDYLTTKNRYLTYQTLTSKTEALTSTKAFLENRDKVILDYLDMLLQRNPDETYKKLINDEITYYNNNLLLIPAVGSLEDCTKTSSDVSDHYRTTALISKQTVGYLLLNKIIDFDKRLSDLENSYADKINLVKNQGKDATTLERWLLETNNKQLLSQKKFNEAQNMIGALKSTKDITQLSNNFTQIQVLIYESNQYLKEAVSYLLEIKEELKYGNY